MNDVIVFLQPIAELFGISAEMLIALSVLFVLLVGAWYVIKFIFKVAWKVVLPGCLLTILALGGLYVVSIFLT